MNIEHFTGKNQEDSKIAGDISHFFDVYIGNKVFEIDIEFGFNKNSWFLPVAIMYSNGLKRIALHFLCFYIAFPIVIRKYIWYPDDEEKIKMNVDIVSIISNFLLCFIGIFFILFVLCIVALLKK